MHELKAVIFDFGGVLVYPQSNDTAEQLQSLSGIAPDRFHDLYWRFRGAYDLGHLKGITYWTEIGRAAGRAYSSENLAALVDVDTRGWMVWNDRMIGWLEKLRASGWKTAILSNMVPELELEIEKLDWVRSCPNRTYSCDLGMAKPQAGIYRHCLDGLGVKAEEALFIDDSQPNVDGALAAGLRSLRFVSAEELAKWVAAESSLPGLDP